MDISAVETHCIVLVENPEQVEGDTISQKKEVETRGTCSPWAEGGVVRREGDEYGPVAFLVQVVFRCVFRREAS